MRNATVSAYTLILLAAITLAACSENQSKLVSGSSAMQPDAARLQLTSFGIDEREALRAKKDPLRDRVWVLSLDDVRVYDGATKSLIRRISLPGWSVVSDVCMPDLALDANGSAVISSNAHPVLWMIDGQRFDLKEIEIALKGRESWAMGFGALVYAPNGSLLALTSMGNSLWTIDIASASAKLVGLYEPPLDACAVPLRAINENSSPSRIAFHG